MVGLNQFYGANLTLNSDVDQKTFGKVTKHNKHDSQEAALSQQVTTRLQGTDTQNTQTWSINQQKRSTKEAPPWNGQ